MRSNTRKISFRRGLADGRTRLLPKRSMPGVMRALGRTTLLNTLEWITVAIVEILRLDDLSFTYVTTVNSQSY